MTAFWKSIKTLNNKNLPLATSINGITGEENISEMWSQHYSGILNCVNNISRKGHVQSVLNSIDSTDRFIITPNDIAMAIRNLKRGKSVGFDLLASEHYIHSDHMLKVFLALLYTSFITHGHLPDTIMKTIIVPLIKSKTGDASDKNNYRPIALVTAASKLLELVLLNNIETCIESSHNQFGFKSKHATDMCIYSLKNVIHYYRQHNSPVFSCFLDASRAFDRIYYWSLYEKLARRGVPLLVVRLLCVWYNSQEFCVKWGTSTSVYFKTSNGVRQGGILSPRLFSLYIDDLSTLLADTQVGCYIDSTCVNHFFYADDMCLLAPSATGLQKLLDVCQQYGVVHDIVYHPVKSMCMTILPKRYKLSIPSLSLNNADLMYTDSIKYIGVVLNSNFNDDGDISRQLRSLYASSNTILRKFAYCTQKVKLHLLESYCLNFYCSAIWCDYSKQSIFKFRVAYNNVFRNLLGYGRRDSASSMFVVNTIDTDA
jgi:hypothetical protein